MTYAAFLIYFLVLPIVLLFAAVRIHKDMLTHRTLFHIFLVSLIALVYTTPWDNYLVKHGIWFYEADRILFTIGYVPIEEYTFFVLQPIFTSIWVCLCSHQRRYLHPNPTDPKTRFTTLSFFILFLILGLVLFGIDHIRGTYYYLITNWSLPVIIALLFLIQRRVTLRLRALLLFILPPTLYLWIVDRYAIANQIWTIEKSTSFDLIIAGLPIEEALFFLVTNILVVLGFLLFEHGDEIFQR